MALRLLSRLAACARFATQFSRCAACVGTGQDRRGWLARIVGSKSVASATPPNEALTGRPTPGAVSATTNDAAEYNWSGFSCPFCNAAGFVSCGGGHLACDGTIQVRKDGRFHQCFCGRAGSSVG